MSDAEAKPKLFAANIKDSGILQLLGILSILFAILTFFLNFLFNFQKDIRLEVSNDIRAGAVLTDVKLASMQTEIDRDNNRISSVEKLLSDLQSTQNILNLQIEESERELAKIKEELHLSMTALSDLTLKPVVVQISADLRNCEPVKSKRPDQPAVFSKITSLCTIPKRALNALPATANIRAVAKGNSHYNLRLVKNTRVGEIEVAEMALRQSPSDRGSAGHAETIITINDVSHEGGTFFISRPAQEGWSLHNDQGWIWIGSLIVYYSLDD